MTRKSRMARLGSDNGRWKGGISKTYYRRIAGALPGQIAHHKGRKRKDITKRDIEVLDNRGISAKAKHNKLHPEKGGYHPKRKVKKK